MSTEVYNLELGLDTRKFERGERAYNRVAESMPKLARSATEVERTYRGAAGSIDRAASSTARLGRQANTARPALAGMNTQMGMVRRTAIGLAASFAATLGAMNALQGGINTMSNFGQAISEVRAITSATDVQFSRLSATARELGETTQFSATEAAEGMAFLARAGFDTDKVLATVGDTLNLAAAGSLDLATSADIASNVLTGFRLEAEEMNRVVDVLAATANRSNTNIQQLGDAMKFVAPVASGLGVSLEDTAAAVGILSDAGLQASIAGTGLRRVMAELEAPGSALEAVLTDLGVSMEDVKVSEVGLHDALEALGDVGEEGFQKIARAAADAGFATDEMQELEQAGIDVSQALEGFGQRGGPALEVLVAATRDGAKSIESFSRVLANADTEEFAKQVAQIKLDNLAGDFRLLRSAAEGFVLAIGVAGAEGGLRDLIQGLTSLVRLGTANLPLIIDLVQGLGAALAVAFAPAIVGMLGAAAGAVIGMISPLTLLAAAVGAVVAFRDDIARAFGFEDAGAALASMRPAFDGVIASLQGLGQEIMIMSGPLRDQLVVAFDRMKSLAQEFFAALNGADTSPAVAALAQVAKFVGGTLMTAFDAALTSLTVLIALLNGDFKAAGEAIAAFFARLIERLGEFADRIDAVLKRISAAINSIKDATGRLKDGVGKSLNGLKEKAQPAVDAFNRVNEAARDMYIGVVGNSWVPDMVEEVGQWFNRLPAAVITPTEKATGEASRAFEELAANTSNAFERALGETEKAAQQLERVQKKFSSKSGGDTEIGLADARLRQSEMEFLIEAARLGEHQLEIAEEMLRVRQQINGISLDDARAIAEQNVALERQLDAVREQNRSIEDIFDTLLGKAKDLWRVFFDDGRDAVNSLKETLEGLFNGLSTGSIFKDLTGGDGLIVNLKNGVGDFVSQTLADTPEGQRRQQAFGNFVATQSRDFLPNNGASNDNTVNALNNVADQIAAFSGEGAFYIGAGRLGLGAADAIDGNGANQTTASAAQFLPALGSFFGPLGTLAGVFGSIGAGLFSKKSSNGARVFLDQDGNVAGTFAKDKGRGDANLATLEDFAGGLQTIVGTLESIVGGSAGSIASNFQLDDRAGLQLINRNQRNNVLRTFGDDIDAAIEFIVDRALSGFRGGNQELLELARSFRSAGVGVEQTLNSLSTIAQVTQSSEPVLGEYAQRVRDINNAFDDAQAAANGVAAAERTLSEARAAQLQIVRDQFREEVRQRTLEISDPLLAGIRSASRQFETLISNATAVGDGTGINSDVGQLIQLELERVFAGALSGGLSTGELNDRLGEFSDVLAEVGVASEITSAALSGAIDNFREAELAASALEREQFGQQVQSDIASLLNDPVSRLDSLLRAQRQRDARAEELGFDQDEVDRLSNLEITDFVRGLTDEAFDQIKSFLGVFEETSAEVERSLDLRRSDLSAVNDNARSLAAAFAEQASQFGEAQIGRSAGEIQGDRRVRAAALLEELRGGNLESGAELRTLLNEFVAEQRRLTGNTSATTEAIDFARNISQQAESLAGDIASTAERQISALDENNDILGQIRDLLSDANAVNSLFRSSAANDNFDAQALISTIQSGVGLTPNSNQNLLPLSAPSLFAQSLIPALSSLGFDSLSSDISASANVTANAADRIGNAMDRLSSLPGLQQLTINAIEDTGEDIQVEIQGLGDRIDDLETRIVQISEDFLSLLRPADEDTAEAA